MRGRCLSQYHSIDMMREDATVGWLSLQIDFNWLMALRQNAGVNQPVQLTAADSC